MTLGNAQRRFARHLADLLQHMLAQGYEFTFGHVYRCQDCPVGIKNSYHKRKLAADINLFKDGKYLDKTEDHAEFGKYWEALDTKNRWGGRFQDGNHYEREY